MKTLNYYNVQMNNGKILEGEKIGKLTRFIIDKFADEGLSVDEAKVVINAAGLNSDKLSKVDDEHKFNITPRKGEYFILNHFDDNFVKHTLFPLPSKKGKGILFSPTTSNNYIMGPSSETIHSVDDFSTDNSIEKIKPFCEQDKRIKLICHDKNKGLIQCRVRPFFCIKGVSSFL